MITFIVPLSGITQVITYRKPPTNSPDRLKQIGLKILQSFNLVNTVPAAGVMFVSRKNQVLSIEPVVWVRDIQTLFYETGCASGTTAVAILEALKQKRSINSFPILQPSGTPLLATVRLSKNKVSFAEIGGQVKRLNKLKIT